MSFAVLPSRPELEFVGGNCDPKLGLTGCDVLGMRFGAASSGVRDLDLAQPRPPSEHETGDPGSDIEGDLEGVRR